MGSPTVLKNPVQGKGERGSKRGKIEEGMVSAKNDLKGKGGQRLFRSDRMGE